MKKTGVVLFSVFIGLSAFAQKNKEFNAVNYYKDFTLTNDVKSLESAKENIDLAAENPDTKENAKTQITKGQIYFSLYELHKKEQEEKAKSTIKDENEQMFAAFLNTPTKELEIAYEAFQKGKKLDEKNKYASELRLVKNIGIYFDNTGRANLNLKKYSEALKSFELAYEIGGAADSTLLYFCAVSAEYAENFPKAKKYYEKMVATNNVKKNTYASLVKVCFELKDTTAALKALKKGREADPNDIGLVIIETNHFLRKGESEKALNNLNIAIAARPEDDNLYLVRGNINDNLANPKDENGEDLEKPADYEKKLEQAVADYKKAIELKPENFDALYNLGALYNNHGVVYSKKADAILEKVANEEMNLKANTLFEKAMPVLEKALEVKPSDRNTLIALKQIYSRLQKLEKLEEINEKLKK